MSPRKAWAEVALRELFRPIRENESWKVRARNQGFRSQYYDKAGLIQKSAEKLLTALGELCFWAPYTARPRTSVDPLVDSLFNLWHSEVRKAVRLALAETKTEVVKRVFYPDKAGASQEEERLADVAALTDLIGGRLDWVQRTNILRRSIAEEVILAKYNYGHRAWAVLNKLEEQSPDIGQGVHGMGTKEGVEDLGAGDQGHMFGYATNETESLMPLTHELSTRLGKRLTDVRKDGTLKWVRPDGKIQVSAEYKKAADGAMIPQRIHTILISTQHSPDVTNEQIKADILEQVIKPVVPAEYLDDDTIYHINPSGRFVIGGPHGDAGLTGRKIIIDTYGGWGAHGGGAFSGKDNSKVDRSAAYATRWAAKSLVASGLAKRALVQVSYAIGVVQPLSMFVDSYGTGVVSDEELCEIVKRNFDFRPGCIIRDLDLKKPQFQKLAAYGHMGRTDLMPKWEQPKDLSHELPKKE
eukprot:gene941-390_t